MARRIALLECSAEIWQRAAASLPNHSVEVVYWSAARAPSEEIRALFPNCFFQRSSFAKRGAPVLEDAPEDGFDDACEAVWRNEYQTVLSQMERFDLYSRDFSTLERGRLFRRYLLVWSRFLSELKPDLLVFPVVPHVAYDYVAFRLAQEKGIQTLFFQPVTVLGPFYSHRSKELREPRSVPVLGRFEELESSVSTPNPIYGSEDLELYDLFSSTDDESIPESERFWNGPSDFASRVARFARIASRAVPLSGKYFKLDPDDFAFKRKGSPFLWTSSRKYPVIVRLWHVILSALDSYSLKRFYESVAVGSLTGLDSESCVYLPLSYQPELSSNPIAGVYENQELFVQAVLAALPSGWKLIVKEHPSQFDPRRQASPLRSRDWYRELVADARVVMVSAKFRSVELIRRSRATVCLSGTSAIEAVCNGVPALVFAFTWFSGLTGVKKISSYRELSTTLQSIEKVTPASRIEVARFFAAVRAANVKVFLDQTSFSSTFEQNLHEASEALVASLVASLQRPR